MIIIDETNNPVEIQRQNKMVVNILVRYMRTLKYVLVYHDIFKQLKHRYYKSMKMFLIAGNYIGYNQQKSLYICDFSTTIVNTHLL